MDHEKFLEVDNFQLFDLLLKFRRNWIWFVLSIIVCCGFSYLFSWTTPNSYLRTASVMIKDDSSIPELNTVFSDRRTTVLSRNSNVKNEVEAFQSPQIIQEVVRRLNLSIEYSRIKNMRYETLYSKSPIKAIFPDSNDKSTFSFKLEIDQDNSFILSNFILYQEKKLKFNQTIRGYLNDTIQTPVGKVLITQTSNYGSEWFYVTLEVSKSSILAKTRVYVKNLKAILASKDNAIIRLELTDNSVLRAEDFLNTLLEIYDEKWLLENNKAAVSTSKFFEEQLKIVKKEVEDLDTLLQKYKSAQLLTDVRSAGTLMMNQSSNYSARIMEINSQLSTANYIQKQLENNISTVLSVTGLNNPSIEMQINTYNEMLMERDRMLFNSSENNYAVRNLNEKLKVFRTSITQSVVNLIEALNEQLKGYQRQAAQMNRQIATNPEQQMKLESIEREHQTKVTQYVGLLEKKMDNDMALVVSVTNTRIISAPFGNNIPVAPKKKILIMAAFFIGVMIPASVIWGKENFDTTIREKKDLESISVPLLGVISKVNKIDSKVKELLFVKENGKDTLNETFRMVRTNLGNLCAKNQKVVMFTSLEPGSGKTFTALNLAMSLALANKKIALLDIDFRTATLSLLISMPEMGIIDFLNERTSDENYVIKKDFYYTGFDVIPVGVIPPNPTEMLMSERFKVLIEKLRTRYDYIFLDSTPLDMVADATIVAKFADISVFVVREGHTDRRKIPVLEETYKRSHFKNMMLILNGSKQEIYISKHHSSYSHRVKTVALLPREAYSPGTTKFLTEGTKKQKQ